MVTGEDRDGPRDQGAGGCDVGEVGTVMGILATPESEEDSGENLVNLDLSEGIAKNK
jgi:hypothetical protein